MQPARLGTALLAAAAMAGAVVPARAESVPIGQTQPAPTDLVRALARHRAATQSRSARPAASLIERASRAAQIAADEEPLPLATSRPDWPPAVLPTLPTEPVVTAVVPSPPEPVTLPEPAAGGPIARKGPSKPSPSATVALTRPGGAAPPVEPARVDPIVPPLTDPDRWEEFVLATTLGGNPFSDGALFVRSPDGQRLAVALAEARKWRLAIDESRVLTLNGEPWYPLDAVPGSDWALDPTTLTVALTIPPDAFERYVVDAEESVAKQAVTGRGGYLDYDLIYQLGERVESRMDGLLEIGAFAEPGAFSSSFLVEDALGEDRDLVRLETQLVRDLPSRRESLRLGDGVTVGGAFAGPVRFGGVQIATNFATDPSFVTFPLPSIGGLAEGRSVVDVFEENLQRVSREVPPGPFEIAQLPVLTGAGEVQLRVTDLLGRERIVTQSYYVSSRLLRQGLHDYSYEIGFPRRDYGEASFDYDDPFLAATHRYGVNDNLTVEGRAEIAMARQSAVVGGAVLLPGLGVISGGLGASQDEDTGGGWLGQLDYEYLGRNFTVGLRTRLASEGFRQLGDEEAQPARVDQASLGFDLGGYGHLGFLVLNRDERETDDQLSLSASYSVGIGDGSLVLSAARILQPDEETALLAAYALPLGSTRSVAASADLSGGDLRARVQARQGKGDSDLGATWRIATEAGQGARAVDASIGYDASLASAQLDAVHQDGDSDLRAGLSGSVALIDGEVRLSRRLGRAFGMVSLPGFANVPVYLDNRLAGRTDGEGYLLLPSLRPYESNRVRIEPGDLPLDATVRSDTATAVPTEGGGVTVRFDVSHDRPASAVLRGPHGDVLPAGTSLAAADGAATALVGRDGFAWVEGAGDRPIDLVAEIDGAAVTCRLPPIPAGEAQPDLGEIACR